MRGRIVAVAGAVALLTSVGAGGAAAGLLDESEWGSSYESTCLYWYDYEGVEQGTIVLCGWQWSSASDGGSYSSRTVRAQRSVQTCDDQGQNCNDAYSEIYEGPADASEFSMDITTGRASFNIALAGETAEDQCTVQATAIATGSYSYNDPFPAVHAYGDRSGAGAQVWMGPDWYQGNLAASPYYQGGYVAHGTRDSVWRQASGSGTVCNWVETQSPGTGSMQSNTDESTTYDLSPGL